MTPDDEPAVLSMMRELWPDGDDTSVSDEVVFVIDREDGGLGGFVAVSLRPYAEGATASPVAHIEGWWVAPDLRRRGGGRRLIEAAEAWAAGRGLCELTSDALLENEAAAVAHQAMGFEVVERIICFRKDL